MISFFKERCQGCELCIDACPKKLLELNKTEVNSRGHNPIKIKDAEKCTGCTLCAVICPDCVIELEG